jgi:NAD(P)-dependent dehydrogenase (short-subunit alcohol dehydrogenase family)
VAVNNAGTEGQVGLITDQTAESYAATFDTNVFGVLLSMKHEVRVMQGQGSGLTRVSIRAGWRSTQHYPVLIRCARANDCVAKGVKRCRRYERPTSLAFDDIMRVRGCPYLSRK